MAALLGYAGGATGTMQVDAQLNGTGDTPNALASSVSGHLGLTMVNGTVTDFMLQGLLGGALNAAGVPAMGGSADVRCFALLTDFRNGQGSVQALALDTSRLSMDGDGSVDMGAETLSLHLRPDRAVGRRGSGRTGFVTRRVWRAAGLAGPGDGRRTLWADDRRAWAERRCMRGQAGRGARGHAGAVADYQSGAAGG